ncbi:MAG: copper amine oxidase N-terminal domain-containing protein, partial [Caldiserica bacterium]|nr:copper amine oxidase N-terminal domain-containing protein [Caldisericota bacterium]
SWSGIFTQRDGPNTFCFRNTASGIVSPPKPQVVELGWTSKTQTVYDCKYNLNLAGAEGFKLSYSGFDMDKFEFGNIEKVLDKSSNNLTIYLDLSKQNTLNCQKIDRFFVQKVEQEFIYDGKAKGFETPTGIVAPKTSPGDKYELKWSGSLKYVYQLDGVINNEWTSGTSLLLTGLQAGNHKLRMLFSNDGMLGKIQEFDFATGQKPPKLQLASKSAQCKDGKIVIKGTTDPDATVDPPATVNADGSFEMTVKVDTCPKTLTIKATNKLGLETVETVSITTTRLVKIFMQLGSSTATDESGNTYTLQVPPQKIKGTTYVPMRFIGERLGAQILWDAKLRKVTYILGSVTVELVIGSTEATVNGRKTKMPGAAVVINGKTLVPVRFVAEALGAKVSFDAASGAITIEYLVQ